MGALAHLIDLPEARVIVQGVKYPQDRIRELEDPCEALENALEQNRSVTFEPTQTLPAVKRRVAKILLALRDRGRKEPE
jgi:hypothetical protein